MYGGLRSEKRKAGRMERVTIYFLWYRGGFVFLVPLYFQQYSRHISRDERHLSP